MKNLTIIGLTPFEKPDVNLISKLHEAGAFPVLSLGHELVTAQESLSLLDKADIPYYGIHISNARLKSLTFSDKVQFVILPIQISVNPSWNQSVIYQVNSLDDAKSRTIRSNRDHHQRK